jgi:phenylpyruvate tautomerase PptA (4-oxalocrotonate tautomerase family)
MVHEIPWRGIPTAQDDGRQVRRPCRGRCESVTGLPYQYQDHTRGVTADQKARLIQARRNCWSMCWAKSQTTVVRHRRGDTDNWGIGGESVTCVGRAAARRGGSGKTLRGRYFRELLVFTASNTTLQQGTT